jgi:arylsulfatase A-like enzyme
VRFDRAYCTYPLCGPSRNSMLTGLYPNASGIHGNGQIFRQTIPRHISLPQAFRHQGYLAVRLGKLYHYGVPNSIGTDGHDDPASWEIEFNPAGVDRLAEEPKMFSLAPGNLGSALSWYASPTGDAHHTDGLLASDASGSSNAPPASRSARSSSPSASSVRTRRSSPEGSLLRLVPRGRHARRARHRGRPGRHPGRRPRQPPAGGADHDRRPTAARPSRPTYASISFMDAQAGRVLDALDRLGLAGNTIVVFTSDHGYHLGEHGLWKKHEPVRGERPGARSSSPPPERNPGARFHRARRPDRPLPHPRRTRSRQSPRQSPGPEPRTHPPATAKGRGWVLSEVVRGGGGGKGKGKGKKADAAPAPRVFGYSLRTDRWRYTEWDEGKAGKELYDHEIDPKELTNLADKPEQADTQAKLAEQLHTAIPTTFPPDGKIPEIPAGNTMYMPLLVDP